MPDCRVEELIPMVSARYSRDHVHEWNAMESRRVHSSRPNMTRLGTRFSIRFDRDKTSHRMIPWSLEAAVQSRRLSKNSKWRENINQSRGLETSRDLTLRVLSKSYRILKRVRGGEHTDRTPPCTKLVRMWNRLEVSRAREPGSWWRLQLVFTAPKIARMWVIPVLGRCFTVVSVTAECWYME